MIDSDPNLNSPLVSTNLDLYVIRTSILHALRETLPNLRGRFLDVGAGNQPYRKLIESEINVDQYVPLDLNKGTQYRDAEFAWDGVSMPFEDGFFDSAMATEVLEHCPEPEVTLNEVSRVLKPGGTFFFTVPFLWTLHDCPNDEYRYTPWSLERHLANSGFEDIKIWPTGGWDASLAQVLGLWVRRRPMSEWKRRWLSRIFFFPIKYLVKKDRPIEEFNHSFYLMPGIAGIAKKPVSETQC